jgi:hypothetical protein
MDETPAGGPADREELLDGVLYDWRSGCGGARPPGGVERVDAFALLLWHIGPPVIVTAEHVRLHIVGYALSGVTPGRRERLQSLYHQRGRPLGTDRRRLERFMALQ